MFGKKDITCTCEIRDFDKVRDYMEYAHRGGYAFDYKDKYTAGMHYYEVTIGLSRYQAEYLATSIIMEHADEFHSRRNKERNAEIEDARREGYAKAVEDQIALSSKD